MVLSSKQLISSAGLDKHKVADGVEVSMYKMFAEGELCPVCAATGRDTSLLCVVESPADVVAIEQTASFRGCYFVLMGHLSPLDGVGPAEIGIGDFEKIAE